MLKWYSYLKNNSEIDNEVKSYKNKALLECETIEENNLVICQKLKYLSFGRFSTYLEFGKHMVKYTQPENRCFFECIFGEKKQRPYFDIEFYTTKDGIRPPNSDEGLYLRDDEADESVKCLVNCIYEEIKSETHTDNPLQLNKSHILVFTSHSSKDDINRKSYHIIIEGFCVSNFKECKEFHDCIVKKMPPEWVNIIDHSVYNSLRQLRIVGNTKWQSNRFKILNNDLTLNYNLTNGWIPKVKPESDNHKLLLLLEASLVSQTTSCVILNYKPEEKKYVNKYSNKSGSDEESTEGFNPLTPDEITEALKLCYTKAGLEFGDRRFPFNYLRTVEDNGTSSLVLLKRLRPSICSACDRKHENENPFLLVVGTNRDIFLDCRRNAENKKVFIGSLGPRPQITEESKKEDEKKPQNIQVPNSKTIVIPKPPPFDPKSLNKPNIQSNKVNLKFKLNFNDD